MTSGAYYAGVVKKKYTLLCVAPDGAQVELNHCHDPIAAQVARETGSKILQIMGESFDMEEGFQIKVIETLESAEDIPLIQQK